MSNRIPDKRSKPLWKCPECGQRFVTRNMSHSCGRHSIDEHFVNKNQEIRAIFDVLVRTVRSIGPMHVYSQKTRIVFQTRGRFVAVIPRRNHLGGHVWLKRLRNHELIYKIDNLGRDFVHNFRISRPEDLDEEFLDLLREAYLVGSQEYDGKRV